MGTEINAKKLAPHNEAVERKIDNRREAEVGV